MTTSPESPLTTYFNSYTMTPTGAALLSRHPLHFLTAADSEDCATIDPNSTNRELGFPTLRFSGR